MSRKFNLPLLPIQNPSRDPFRGSIATHKVRCLGYRTAHYRKALGEIYLVVQNVLGEILNK